jgi:hypothetical protein
MLMPQFKYLGGGGEKAFFLIKKTYMENVYGFTPLKYLGNSHGFIRTLKHLR